MCREGYWCPTSQSCKQPNEPCESIGKPPEEIGPPGMPPEDWETRQEEIRQMFDKKRLENMKKNIPQLEKFNKAVTAKKTQIEKILIRSKYKIAFPKYLKEAIAQLPKIIETLKNAKSIDDIDEIEIYDTMKSLQNIAMELRDLLNLDPELKNADKEVNTNMLQKVKKAKTFLKKMPDLIDSVSELESLQATMKQTFNEAVKLAQDGESQESRQKVQDEIWSNTEEFYNASNIIERIGEFAQSLRKDNTRIKQLEREINLLRKTIGKDLYNELKENIQELKNLLKEANQLLKQKDKDIYDIQDMAETFGAALMEVENRLAELRGASIYKPVYKPYVVEKGIVLPEAFNFNF